MIVVTAQGSSSGAESNSHHDAIGHPSAKPAYTPTTHSVKLNYFTPSRVRRDLNLTPPPSLMTHHCYNNSSASFDNGPTLCNPPPTHSTRPHHKPKISRHSIC